MEREEKLMPTPKDIADRLESIGIDDYTIDYQRGIAIIYLSNPPSEETQNKTNERRKQERQVLSCPVKNTII